MPKAKNPRSEENVKKEIAKVLDRNGYYYFMPKANVYGVNGVPDFIVCACGLFIGIEAKAAGIDEPDPAQVDQRELIFKAQGEYILTNADNVHTLEDRIKCYIKTAR